MGKIESIDRYISDAYDYWRNPRMAGAKHAIAQNETSNAEAGEKDIEGSEYRDAITRKRSGFDKSTRDHQGEIDCAQYYKDA